MRPDAPSSFSPEDATPRQTYWPTDHGYDWQLGLLRFLLSSDAYKDIATFLGGEEALTLSKPDMHGLHHRAIGFLQRSMDGRLRRRFVGAIKEYAETVIGPNSARPIPAEAERPIREVDEQGYTALPAIPTDWADDIREHAAGTVMHNWAADVEGPPESLRANHNLALCSRPPLLTLPHIREIATDPVVGAAVEQHLGAPPILLSIGLWCSFAGKQAKDAQFFHFDLDDYRFCKLFIYLTDVDEDGGPHVYLPRTHDPDYIAACRPEPGPARDEFDWWYFHDLRKQDADATRHLKQDPVNLTGPKGSRLLVNTEGIHKGLPPQNQDRWLLQLLFGVSHFTQWGGQFDAPVLAAANPAEAYLLNGLFPTHSPQ
ncbi:hypothetical protein EOI86_13295 [Hwanghaeella grinnelliae]|uniref:Phytanoyl-CoA dioxygenase n=1 Tax=Hwanghaeella grinnelliae TaxID=2500179 RepID=A0A437QP03_9PROT|nr:hypothetical protein [Hwanghaeella grinnelliae]RVU36194.1 hypothetical protein EOI86_13295 [Hwanghaeella grinnelliae]